MLFIKIWWRQRDDLNGENIISTKFHQEILSLTHPKGQIKLKEQHPFYLFHVCFWICIYLTNDKCLHNFILKFEDYYVKYFFLTTAVSTSSMGSTESSTRSSFSEGKLTLNLKGKTEKIMKAARVKNQSPYAYPNEEEKKAPIEVNEINKDQERTNSNSAKDLSGSLKPKEALNDSIICSICKKKRPMIGRERSFSYADLLDATNEFSAENLISEGGYGAVFKGELRNTTTIAVKKQKETSFQGEKKFKSEVQALEKTRHKNVVILLGSCSEERHRLLVYEYICNGSLDNHLSSKII